ncbi:hypothetical protein KKA15_05295 [Patescibacteria group bacterium]|nr:hypothetical protein [Patescibacteria group bacterium]
MGDLEKQLQDDLPQNKAVDKSQEKVVAPFSGKKLLVYIVNVVLFIVYWMILQFLSGFILGALDAMGVVSIAEVDDSFWGIVGIITLVITIIITIVLRKNIYFKIKKV